MLRYRDRQREARRLQDGCTTSERQPPRPTGKSGPRLGGESFAGLGTSRPPHPDWFDRRAPNGGRVHPELLVPALAAAGLRRAPGQLVWRFLGWDVGAAAAHRTAAIRILC